MFGTLIDYWWLTGDSTYNDVTMQAMLHQVGTDEDFMPKNQTQAEGNDDQGFWAMAALSAAEHKFPDPPSDKPQWLALAQAVFNEYVGRWDTTVCGGGMRWQIFSFNSGYDYKNSISNGCFFNVAARLARYTGNETYAEWATKVFEWHQTEGLISADYLVYDGAHFSGGNCSDIDKTTWTYNAGIMLHAAAVMYNITEKESWKTVIDGILATTQEKFFDKDTNVVSELYCEGAGQCGIDQQTFKGYLLRWLAATTQMAPYTYDTIQPWIKASAAAAAKVCTGSPEKGFSGIAGTACGFSWVATAFDGMVGVGPQMSSLSAIMYPLVDGTTSTPLTNTTGGTSKGKDNAGNTDEKSKLPQLKDITTGDRVGAGILTALMLTSLIGGCVFLIKDERYY